MITINFSTSEIENIKESFGSIANLKTSTSEGQTDMTLKPSIGQGVISISKISNDIMNITFNVHCNEDFDVHLSHNSKHCLDFVYSLEGSWKQKLSNNLNFVPVSFRQNSIFGRSPKTKNVIKFLSGIPTIISLIVYQRSSDDGLLEETDNKLLRAFALRELNNNFDFEDFKYLGRICFKTAHYAKALIANNDKSSPRYLYKEAAVINIMASQWEEYQKDLMNKSNKKPLKSSELDKIAALENFISMNLAENLAINRLVRVSGLNPAKLQVGFHYLFDTTISNYVKHKRLDKAVQLIRETDYNVSELVYSVGFSSRSYFSKIFKERYGVLPSQCVSNPNLIMAV